MRLPPSTAVQPRFSARFELVDKNILDEMMPTLSPEEISGKESLGNDLWTFRDKAISPKQALSMDASVCLMWGAYSPLGVILHHMMPATFEDNKELKGCSETFPRQELPLLGDKPRGFLMGCEALADGTEMALNKMLPLFRKLKLPFSSFIGRTAFGTSMGMHYSVPEDTVKFSIYHRNDGVDQSISTLRDLKKALWWIQLDAGDELVVQGKRVPHAKVNQFQSCDAVAEMRGLPRSNFWRELFGRFLDGE